MENVICKSHHAVVTLSGDIDEPMMLQLATSLQQLHHGCYYNHIELTGDRNRNIIEPMMAVGHGCYSRKSHHRVAWSRRLITAWK